MESREGNAREVGRIHRQQEQKMGKAERKEELERGKDFPAVQCCLGPAEVNTPRKGK